MLERRASVNTDVHPVARLNDILGDYAVARVVISGQVARPYRRKYNDRREQCKDPKIHPGIAWRRRLLIRCQRIAPQSRPHIDILSQPLRSTAIPAAIPACVPNLFSDKTRTKSPSPRRADNGYMMDG